MTEGKTCKVTMKAFPDFEATGTVKSVSKVPYAGTKFDCVVTLRAGKNRPDLLPTMTCDLEFANGEESEEAGDKKSKKQKDAKE